VADFILDSTDPKDRLLSIGCGSGYVEFLLSQAPREVTAIEPSREATRLLFHYPAVKSISGYFPECLQSDGRPPYDVAYLNTIEYCLTEDEFTGLLKQIYDYPIKKVIVISLTFYHPSDLSRCFKDYLKEILKFCKVYHPGQFWGYQRTVAELTHAVSKAGYNDVQTGCVYNGCLWVKGEKR
jgi:hypothetical protein